MQIINIPLIANPLNWVTVALFLIFIGTSSIIVSGDF